MRSIFRLTVAVWLATWALMPLAASASAQAEAADGRIAGRVIAGVAESVTPAQMLARFERGEGTPFGRDVLYPIQRGQALWMWVDLPRSAHVGEAVLSIDYAGLDGARLYLPQPDGSWAVEQAGDLLAVNDWTIPSRYPALPLMLGPDAPARVLLEVRHSHPVTLPWRMQSMASFQADNQRALLLLGMYLGLVALVVVLGAFNSVVLRDPLYAFYAVNILMLSITQSTLTGLAGQFFWPDHPWWNDVASMVMPVLGLLTASAFVLAVIRPVPWRWLLRLFQVFMAAGLVIALVILTVGRNPGFLLANLYFLAGIPLCLGPLIWFSRARSRFGWWLVAGMSGLFLGGLFIPLRNAGFMPLNTLTQIGPQIGAAMEIPLLLIGLHLLSRRRRDALVRRAALQTRDPVTGLLNDRLTRERLDHLVQRMKGQPGGSCVMRVRIGNYGQVVADYGIQAGAVTSAHAASCLGLITREGDSLGRLRDGDFLLVLERRLTEGQAMQEATRAVARGLAQSTQAPVSPPIRLFVAISLTAHESRNAESLLAQMNLLLLDIATNPQKVIRVAQSRQVPAAPPNQPEPT